MTPQLRRRIWLVLEDTHSDLWLQRAVEIPMILLIVANVAAVAAETVQPFAEDHRQALRNFEIFSVAVFTAEYLARIWISTENPAFSDRSAWKTRLFYVGSPFALIDLLAILPFYVSLLFPVVDLRMLRAFRLLRLLKLARYSPALVTLSRVIVDERRALFAALLIMVVLLMLAASAIYYVEGDIQPEVFSSIPAAMWWALTTLTTVGYGDVVPVTDLGKVIGGLVMLFGLGMFALPIGIIASGFSSEIHRRDFVVTWGMVARVPLFANLDALSVSRITSRLRASYVPPDSTIFRKGDVSDGLYFIASGAVQVLLPSGAVRLEEGDFFGETALLRKGLRTATVRSVTKCRLLVLAESDFHELMAADGDFRDAVNAVAEERLARDDEMLAGGDTEAAQ